MQIALDATYSTGNNLTGIGVYSVRLLNGLASTFPHDRFLHCYRPKQFRYAPDPGFLNVKRRLLQPPIPLFRADLFHGLNQRVDRRPAPRVVSTFHDLFVLTSDYSTAEFKARFAKQARMAAANSDLIIAVSSFTAEQVSTLLSVSKARIRVIPHGVDMPRELQSGPRENLVLFVGSIQARKNVMRLVDAFGQLPEDWRLVLAGSQDGYGATEILEHIQSRSWCSRVELTGRRSQEELESLYSRASIFAFPTLDEGFGIPVLEAMAHGLPVITSNCSALPEVAGNAAVLVDPKSTEEIADALLELAGNPDKREKLKDAGRIHAAKYPWNAAVERTHAVYEELSA